MQKKLITICAVILFTAVSASAQFTVYPDDRPGWESAVGVYEEEFFEDATFNPGVSVVSGYPGYVDTTKEVWWDRLVCSPPTTTIWMFDTQIRGFGGNWNPGVPGGPGAGIQVAINGTWVDVGEIPETYIDKFWGFVSAEPFRVVRLMHGSRCDIAWCETYEMDNMVYSYAVDLDIKPQSCPNPLNIDSRGVLTVAILGTESFDVTTIDLDTITLEGVYPLRSGLEDASRPVVNKVNICDCTEEGPDGFLDLMLKFNTQELVAEMGRNVLLELKGEMVELILTGYLKEEFGGRHIAGVDCVRIQTSKN